MPFALGATSRSHLVGVSPRLVAVVERAIVLTAQDFGVHEGVRTIETQREYVRTGVSRTLASKHLPQDDGLGHAVDLVPYVAGRLRWEWPPIYVVARAMRDAAREQGVAIRWGAVWDRDLRNLSDDLHAERMAYNARHVGDDFNDGPHYELIG